MTNYKLILITILVATILGANLVFTREPRNQQASINKDDLKQPILNFIEKKNQNAFYKTDASKLFCDTNVKWLQYKSDSEIIAFSSSQCLNVKAENSILITESGAGTDNKFYKLKKVDGKWTVADYDEREFAGASSKPWVVDSEKLVPNEIMGSRCLYNCYSTEGVIKKAADYYKVDVPETYTDWACKSDTECQDGYTCAQQPYPDKGPSVCVKRCDSDNECGAAHICRSSCIYGENGCPSTAVSICIPSIY